MGNAKLNTWVQYVVVIGLVLLLIGSFTWMNSTIVVNTPTASEIAAAIIIPTMSGNLSIDNDKIDAIYDEILRDDNAEEIAEQLALDEIDTKDFEKDLVSFLETEIDIIEDIDYKDIVEIVIKDIDTVVIGDKATVEIEFKVYVANYGDKDEEERARVSVVFDIVDLDEDDDYEDAEVYGYDTFNLIRFYD